MVNLKFDIGIACFFGYSIIMTFMNHAEMVVIVFGQNGIIIIVEINEIAML